jgi:hypothetical protein
MENVMMNRNTKTAPAQAQADNAPASYLTVSIVEDYEDASGEKAARWTKVGAAFPHKDGKGFNIELSALPLNGKLVLREPTRDDNANSRR